MCTIPDVLAKMSENLDWTQDLGDAFLGQKNELLDTAQRMRGKAHDSGNLKTTEQQVVTVKEEKIIVIESPNPKSSTSPPTRRPWSTPAGLSLLVLPADVPLLPVGAGLVDLRRRYRRRRGALGRLRLGLGAQQRLHQPQQLQQLQSQHEHQSQQSERQPRELEPRRESPRRRQLQELEAWPGSTAPRAARTASRRVPAERRPRRAVIPGAAARAPRQARTPSASARAARVAAARSGTSASSGHRAASGQKAAASDVELLRRVGSGRSGLRWLIAARAPRAPRAIAARRAADRCSYGGRRLPRWRWHVPWRWRRTAQVNGRSGHETSDHDLRSPQLACVAGLAGLLLLSAGCKRAEPGTYATPEEAVQAPERDRRHRENPKTEVMFGPGSVEMFRSGDDAEDAEAVG